MHSYTMNVDSIIMQEVVNSFSSKSVCLTGLVSALFAKVPKLLLFIVAKKCIESSSSVLTPLQDLLKKLFIRLAYTTESFALKHPSNKEYFYATKFKENATSLEEKGLLPTHVRVENETVFVDYLSYANKQEIECIKALGEDDFRLYQKTLKKKKVLYETACLVKNEVKYVPCTASALYASKNYTKLGKMIASHFEISALVSTNNVLGILLDGIPGLGKTKFADYAANTTLASSIFKIDMTAFINQSFQSVLDAIYYSRKVITNTIFMIDELDKYMDARLQKEFYSQPEERKLEWDEFCAYIKLDYLHSMLRILERDDISAPVIVIFCSNNFHSIFEGVDITHHRSLYDRFMKVQFHPCDKDELIDYCLYYNEQLKGTDYHTAISKEELHEQLDEDISITFRALHYLSIEAMYKIDKLVDLIIAYKPVVLNIEEKKIVRNGILSSTESEVVKNSNNDIHISQEDNDSYEESEDEVVVTISEFAKRNWILTVKKYLNMNNSIHTTLELFDYMATSDITDSFLSQQPALKETLVNKLKEIMQHEDQPLVLTNKRTKEFIHELTGYEL